MPKPEIQIMVCLNERPPDPPRSKPSCAPRGSLEVYHRFKDRVKELGLRDRIMVVRTGCLKHCSQGITVAVWPYNFWYRGVRVEDVDEILAASVPTPERPAYLVERLEMPDIPWE